MRTCIGTSRVAFVGEHRTVKIPRPCLFSAAIEEATLILHGIFRRRLSKTIEYLQKDASSDITALVVSNRREEAFSAPLSGIVVPTRSYLGGLLTGQPTTEDLPLADDDVWMAMCWAIGEDVILQKGVGHTFEKVANFGSLCGTVLIRDFGDENVPELLLAHKEAVRRELQKLAIELK